MNLKTLLLTLIFALSIPFISISAGDKCVMCGSGSSNGCQQCKLNNNEDSFKNRKACENAGCKISGTTSCSTAANVKVCTGK